MLLRKKVRKQDLFTNRKPYAKMQFHRFPLGRSECGCGSRMEDVDVTDVSRTTQSPTVKNSFELFTERCGQRGERGGGGKSSQSWGE